MSAYISIGRNIGMTPMPQARWEDFISRVAEAAISFAGPLVSLTTGYGLYNGEREECAIIVTGSSLVRVSNALVVSLKALAREFEQDSIALTVGNPEFITP